MVSQMLRKFNTQEQGFGKVRVQYRLRDWLISRQRYWGAHPSDSLSQLHGTFQLEEDLPRLPDNVTFTGRSLAVSSTGQLGECALSNLWASRTRWIRLLIRPGISCAILMRAAGFRPAKTNDWMPVDQYVWAKHAILHLLYWFFY